MYNIPRIKKKKNIENHSVDERIKTVRSCVSPEAFV